MLCVNTSSRAVVKEKSANRFWKTSDLKIAISKLSAIWIGFRWSFVSWTLGILFCFAMFFISSAMFLLLFSAFSSFTLPLALLSFPRLFLALSPSFRFAFFTFSSFSGWRICWNFLWSSYTLIKMYINFKFKLQRIKTLDQNSPGETVEAFWLRSQFLP